MTDLMRVIVRETKVKCKYHMIGSVIVNLALLLAIGGSFAIGRIYMGAFILLVSSAANIAQPFDTDAERFLPISDQERQNRAILKGIFFSGKLCLIAWIGMMMGSRNVLLSISGILFLIMAFFFILSLQTGVARKFYSGDVRKGERSFFRLISIIADVVFFVLEAIAFGGLFFQEKLIQLLSTKTWNMILIILSLLFILAFVDDLHPWEFSDLEPDNDIEPAESK